MTGKPTIPKSVHAKIRKLHKAGMTVTAIAGAIGCSTYTVRKAIDPDFVERERVRQRELGPERYAARKMDEAYLAYQEQYSKTEQRRAKARESMARLRKLRAKPT